jgi:acyl-CoA synthetase (AMP-forming)/AMP-acid ligase II
MPRGTDPATYSDLLRKVLAGSQPRLIAVASEVIRLFEALDLDVGAVAFEDLDSSAAFEPSVASEGDPVLIQYSSGSTGAPRGCVISAQAIGRQLAMLSEALQIDPERDIGVVWLPLAHDMGLIGCLLLTYWTGHRLVLGTPQRFLTGPHTWMSDCAQFQATVTATPSFALDLVARTAAAVPPTPIPMAKMVVGGDRVRAASIQAACQALGEDRLPQSALLPAYGLAEATLAVCMTDLGLGPRYLSVDKPALGDGAVQESSEPDRSITLTSAGSALPGCEVAVASDAEAGEILVRSHSLASGYLSSPDETAARFTTAGLQTGDIGFLHDGQLYVTGRNDDLIIVGGRNIYASDVEETIASADGVRPGGCAVVDIDGAHGQRLVALVELRGRHPDFSVLAENIGQSARRRAGVQLAECIFVPHGALPKTPSGKLQRFKCRDLVGSPSSEAVRIRCR